MTDDISKVEACPFCKSPRAMTRGWIGQWWVECMACGAQGPEMEAQGEAVNAWNHRLESATTPAEVAPIAWRFDYCGVKPMVWLEKPAENAPMFTNIRALVYADDYATLARQLAEANDTARSYIQGAKLDALTRADMQKENRLLQSQLAEATRRLGEVEPMLRSLIEQLGRAFLDEKSRATGEGEGHAEG